MKKIFLMMSIISVLFLVGCNEKQDNINKELEDKINEESTSEINDNEELASEENNEKIENVEPDEENTEINDELIEEEVLIDVKNQTIEKTLEANGLITNNSYIVNWIVVGEQYDGNVLTINLESDDVKKFNSNFQEIMESEINEEYTSGVHRCKYYINDNILSVVTYVFAESGGNHLVNTYNFDILTGKKVETIDILKYKNINEENFKQKLPEIYKAAFLKQSPQSYIDGEWKDVWNKIEDIENEWDIDLYNKTISEIPSDINEIQVYLDYDGNLHILAGVERIAGSDGIEFYDVNFEKKEQNNPYMAYSPLDYSYTEAYEKIINYYANSVDATFEHITSEDELQILRNLPFAKKGHDFKNADLKEFFNYESWYKRIEGKTVTLEELSADEQKVISMIDARINNLREN